MGIAFGYFGHKGRWSNFKCSFQTVYMTFLLFCLEDADNFWCCIDDIWNYVNWKSIQVTENQYKLQIERSMKLCTPYLCQRKNASQSVFVIQCMFSSQAVCFPSQGIFNTSIGKPLYNSSKFYFQEPLFGKYV